jgi:hypothetical protein
MHAIPNTPAPLARHEIYAALCNYLPPPSPDTPEARAVRNERAIALRPETPPRPNSPPKPATGLVCGVSCRAEYAWLRLLS